jgi:hypothetical protein
MRPVGGGGGGCGSGSKTGMNALLLEGKRGLGSLPSRTGGSASAAVEAAAASRDRVKQRA